MRVPRHVAIIMDGNGRWARSRGLPRAAGHRAGLTPVRITIRQCIERGVAALTLFAFSSENWKRPPQEVGLLMNLFLEALEREIDELAREGVAISFIGRRDELAPALVERMTAAEQRTSTNSRLRLVIAMAYGGRDDIVGAARRLAAECHAGRLEPGQIDEARFAAQLALAGLPEPDLFIRTGGEHRISNFLLWNLAYTELWFTDAYWPDFDAAAFAGALESFAQRERRFGKTSQQLGGERC